MRLREIGIRGQLTGLVILLVLGASYIVPRWLFDDVRAIVEEHEVVDLRDEAMLRGWELRDLLSGLHEDIGDLASGRSGLAPLREAVGVPPWDLDPSLRGRLPRQWDRFLKVVILDREGTPRPGTIVFRAGCEALSPPPGLVSSPGETAPGATIRFSRVLPLDLSPAFAGGEGQMPRFRTPAVWAGAPLPGPEGGSLWILMDLALRGSPRHIAFLLDEDGSFLMHPEPDFIRSGGRDTTFRHLDLAEAFHQSAWMGEEANVRLGELHAMPWLRSPYLFIEGVPDAAFGAAVRDLERQDPAAFLSALDRLRAKYEPRGVRVGGISGGVSEIRLLARPGVDPAALKAEIREDLGKFLPGRPPAIGWRPLVNCARGDAQLVRVTLHSHAGPATYCLVYSAFREELISSINNELATLNRVSILLALLAGAIAFLISLFFVRPLLRVAATARHVSASSTENLPDKIEAVRRALPARRSDEVGQIARALEALLLQVLNAHERLRQLNADLEGRIRERTQELQEAYEQLKGLSVAKDEFLASVSHELRQPLNSIFGFLQFLEMSGLDEAQRADVRKIRNAAIYLRNLISDILDYQKIVMGVLELEPQEIDAREFLASLRDSVEVQAREFGNSLDFEIPADIGVLRNDPQRLQQVLLNLLSNACKFTRDGRVTLRARREHAAVGHDWITFAVIDTGRGMRPEEQQNLFVKFKKLSAKEGNKSGTGLGLVITKGLCELMGGDISFASEFGKGTTFTLRVPAEIGAAQARPQPPAQERPQRPASPIPTVLVIDDDPAVHELMSRFLGQNGYRVLTAANAEEGIAAASREMPDAITLDAVMPGRDGWDVLAALKTDPRTAPIPVVMVTFRDERGKGFALGAADYIVKPIHWQGLQKTLDRLCGASPGPVRSVLVIEDDAEARELFRRTLAAAGWEVIEAENGAEGLKALGARRPDAIILDLMMPVMDGFEFVAEYTRRRLDDGSVPIPILVVTAKDPTAPERARLNGFVEGILQKGGHTQEELLGEILAMIARHAPRAP